MLSITPTLLNSYDWYKNAPISWKEKALNDIKATIRRETKEYNKATLKGAEFEDLVYKYANLPPESLVSGSEPFKETVDRCRGGRFQEWTSVFFDWQGEEVRAYGKIDVLLPEKVIDIKTTGQYKGASSYTKGWQPVVYMLGAGVDNFEFLVAEWLHPDSKQIKDIHIVPVKKTLDLKEKLVQEYDEFCMWLKSSDLWEDYYKIFCKNR